MYSVVFRFKQTVFGTKQIHKISNMITIQTLFNKIEYVHKYRKLSKPN